jgi:hypothetical protein
VSSNPASRCCYISVGVRLVSGELDYLEIKNSLRQLGLAA